jgi:Domain of unknown function (DUF4423)
MPAIFFGCSPMECRYLLLLLQESRAGTQALKRHLREQREELKEQALSVQDRTPKEREMTDTELAQFYSSWTYSTVHLLSTLDKSISIGEAQRFLGLSAAKFRRILDFLISSRMIRVTDDLIQPGTQLTHIGKDSPFLVKHHLNWRLKSAQAAEDLTDEELMYTANFSISEKDFQTFREEIVKFIQRFLSVVKDSPAENIAQFNIDYFWIRK